MAAWRRNLTSLMTARVSKRSSRVQRFSNLPCLPRSSGRWYWGGIKFSVSTCFHLRFPLLNYYRSATIRAPLFHRGAAILFAFGPTPFASFSYLRASGLLPGLLASSLMLLVPPSFPASQPQAFPHVLHCVFERVLLEFDSHCTDSTSGVDLKHDPI
jgi:hypothetical protein